MFAKEKWSLKAVKWWGGWSEGEETGTIMRYLLDEYNRYELGFSDMLSPVRQDSRHAVFMGETDTPGMAPATQQGLAASLETLRATVDKETAHQFSILKQEMQYRHETMERRHQESTKTLLDTIRRLTVTEPRPSAVVQHPIDPVTQEQTPQLPQRIGKVIQQEQQQQPCVIPPAAPRIPTISKWQDAVEQWENGDPSKGLLIPLRSWTKAMRKTDSAKYSQRKSIAMEFIYLGRNEANVKDVHGKAADTVRQLLKSIHQKNLEREHTDAVGTSSSGLQDHGRDDEHEDEDEEVEPEPLVRRRLNQQPRHVIQSVEGHCAEQVEGQGQSENGGNGDESPEPLGAKRVNQQPLKPRIAIPRVTRSKSVALATAPASTTTTPISLPTVKRLRRGSTIVGITSSSCVDNRKRQR
ncbi:hypothetical protein KI688_012417 [Linnemannia hyalina]|uniref:Uncharacterized protein n=1 Tax=Linnemannia hyalina TaxID=64524 RepID=A0A9P8BW61_9FUNG|nr:hypothetical protein KI688_012417 [Linnemannia hyalina]